MPILEAVGRTGRKPELVVMQRGRHVTAGLLAPVEWWPLMALLLIGVASASGAGIRTATAATSENVTVTATVPAALSISIASCGAGAVGMTVSFDAVAYSSTACHVDYGSTNDATTRLTVADSNAAPFLGTIPNTTANCGALSSATTDQAGIHIVGTANDSSIAAAWATSCTTPATAGTNTRFRAVPPSGSPATACESTTTVATNHRCSFEWGVAEGAADGTLAAGQHTGIAVFTVVDY